MPMAIVMLKYGHSQQTSASHKKAGKVLKMNKSTDDNATKMAKKMISMRIEKEILEKIRELAKMDNRTVTGYVENTLKKHINTYYERNCFNDSQ